MSLLFMFWKGFLFCTIQETVLLIFSLFVFPLIILISLITSFNLLQILYNTSCFNPSEFCINSLTTGINISYASVALSILLLSSISGKLNIFWLKQTSL